MEVTGREKNFWIVAFDKQISSGHDVMTSACVTLALIIVVVGVLLATGCTRQPAFGNMTANSTAIGTPSTLIIQPIQTPCPQSENTTPYIIINPIGNHYVDEVFEINGTTNFGVDKKIKFSIYEPHLLQPYGVTIDPNHHYSGLIGFVTLREGYCGINSWLYSANLSGFHPGSYSVNMVSNNTVYNYTTMSVN